jgi:hypothetical protein
MNSLLYVVFDFFTFMSFTNDNAWWKTWSTIILLIIRTNWITKLIIFMKIVVIFIKSSEIMKIIMSRHFSINDNWSYSKNRFTSETITQSTNSSENSSIAENKFAFRIMTRFIFKTTLIKRYFFFFFWREIKNFDKIHSRISTRRFWFDFLSFSRQSQSTFWKSET